VLARFVSMCVLNLDAGLPASWTEARGRPFSADVRGEETDECRLSFQVAREVVRWVRVGSPSELWASSASCRNRSAFASGCVWSMATSCAVKASSVASSLEGLRLPARVVFGREPARVWDDVL
jgi:hypothetical protein